MQIVVTGASAYIGAALVARLHERGHVVLSAGRHTTDAVAFDLSAPAPITLPPCDAVIHAAAVTTGVIARSHKRRGNPARHSMSGSPRDCVARDDENNENFEIATAHHLIAASQQVGARFLFLSSQTAALDAPTNYGRTKWAIEQMVTAAGGVNIRPGQVYGGAERGLFGTLVQLTRRAPLLPAFFPAPKVQPVQVDDLVSGILAILENPSLHGETFCLGAATPITFTDFLRMLKREYGDSCHSHENGNPAVSRVADAPRWIPAFAGMPTRHRAIFLPIPTLPIRLLARVTHQPALIRLTSLFALPVMETAADWMRLGITPTPIQNIAAIDEANAMLHYVSGGHAPNPDSVARYRQLFADQPALNLPTWALRFPRLLTLYDTPSARHTVFDARLNAASLLYEATKQGARLLQSPSWLRAMGALTGAVVMEVMWRALSLCTKRRAP